jgi:hypothetical protein
LGGSNLEVMTKENDLEVRYQNNTYLVRFVDEEIHILIPALSMTVYAGDDYLEEKAKKEIVNLALSSLVV